MNSSSIHCYVEAEISSMDVCWLAMQLQGLQSPAQETVWGGGVREGCVVAPWQLHHTAAGSRIGALASCEVKAPQVVRPQTQATKKSLLNLLVVLHAAHLVVAAVVSIA
jgi:hypothetical protein